MRAVLQRVRRASVQIEGVDTRSINRGLMILLGVALEDNTSDADWMVRKIAAMRLFNDDTGKMNRSLIDINGEAIVVSQFTLLASTRKGNRPSFDQAAPPPLARRLYDNFVHKLSKTLEGKVLTGAFGATMYVELVNEGPVTIVLDSKNTV